MAVQDTSEMAKPSPCGSTGMTRSASLGMTGGRYVDKAATSRLLDKDLFPLLVIG